MADETALLSAARKGDQKALAEIFDLYAKPIYRYALRLTRDTIEADNIVGDVFSRLLEQLKDNKGPKTNLRSYLYQIAYHIIVDRSRDARQVVSLDIVLDTQDGNPAVDGEVEDRTLMEAILSSINSDLSDDQRQVVILRFLEGLSPEEVARVLEKSVSNVKVIQTRAIAKLRDELNRRFGKER
jgi:RNA polymerase sigma-70 factor (ECF subfamily)